jgi:hypothetical protein
MLAMATAIVRVGEGYSNMRIVGRCNDALVELVEK